jgi:Response regulator containing a CheY-like receiver domain and an HTH DNA-binding domain
MPFRVLVVDDQTISRQLFESFIASSERYELAASVSTARYADSYCATGKVDLVLMDVVMNDGSNGLDTAQRIKKSYPEIKVIVVTSMPDSLFLTRARRIGVDSFWYKEAQAVPMLEIMDRTMAGERVFPDHPPITQLGLAGSDEFTERELEVLRLLSEGLTDREIAGKLFLSVTTVRFHINNLLGKTGLSSRTELAVRAVRSGIAVPGMD